MASTTTTRQRKTTGSVGNIRDLRICVSGEQKPAAEPTPRPAETTIEDEAPTPTKEGHMMVSPHRRKKLVVIGNVTLYEHQYFNIISCVFGMESRVNWKTMDVAIIMLKPIEHCLGFVKKARSANSKLFILVIDSDANESAILRENCFRHGANMVTCCPDSVSHVLNLIGREGNPPGPFTCPYCKQTDLSEDDLWTHAPLYHINEHSPHQHTCPICLKPSSEQKKNFQTHLRNFHGPVARQEILPEIRRGVATHAFALVVCHRMSDNKFLVVQEFGNAGFWLPGGMATPGETLMDAAIRETLEEAGIYVNLIGVLRIEHSVYNNGQTYNRMRVIFYAQPVDPSVRPKSLPDYQSAGACWVDLNELEQIKLRGTEPQEWFPYILNNGDIYPITILECWKHDGGRGRKQTGTSAPIPSSKPKREERPPIPSRTFSPEPHGNGIASLSVASAAFQRPDFAHSNGLFNGGHGGHGGHSKSLSAGSLESMVYRGSGDETPQDHEIRSGIGMKLQHIGEDEDGERYVSSPGEHRQNRSVRYVPRNEPRGRIALRTARKRSGGSGNGRPARVGQMRY